MHARQWKVDLADLLRLQELAAGSADGDLRDYETALDQVEQRLLKDASLPNVRSEEDALNALHIALDIAKVEALASMRSETMPALIEGVANWISSKALRDPT